MKWFWFPIAVAATSLALVAALVAVVAFPVRGALASTLGASGFATNGSWSNGPWRGGPWGNGSGFTLPTELQGLTSVPADQRFDHFVGAQLNLTDKDGKPLTITVTPGSVTTASATSLTIAANDGSSKTFSLTNQTMLHGPGATNSSGTTSTPTTGDKVVVVTVDQSTTATAVIDPGAHGFGQFGPGSPTATTGSSH